MADESKEGILYDSLAFLTKKLVIEGVFLQTYEFQCPKSNNEASVSFLLLFCILGESYLCDQLFTMEILFTKNVCT